MSHCMYLKDDLMTFSDGSVLYLAFKFGEGEAHLCPPEVESLSSDLGWNLLHPLHANATAFWGPIWLLISGSQNGLKDS